MIDPVLDYEIPFRPLSFAWVGAAALTIVAGVWFYHPLVMFLFICTILLWTDVYSTALHYALDAEEFNKLPVVGEAFVRFQSHHFPRWINTIYRKPVIDLVGELNPLAILNIAVPLLIFRLRDGEMFVTWGTIMLAGSVAMICHRWAHQPDTTKPELAKVLQRLHLALSPAAHWRHHAQAVDPKVNFVQNYNLSFGWSNRLFNRVLQIIPSPRIWLAFIAVTTFTQVWVFAMFLRWLHRQA